MNRAEPRPLALGLLITNTRTHPDLVPCFINLDWLRKFDYDAGRAAEYIRKNQLTSKLLAAKMQLNDYDIIPEEYR